MDRRSRIAKQPRAYTSDIADALNRRIELHTARQQHIVLRHMLSEFPTSEPFTGAQIMKLRQRMRIFLIRHLRLEDERLYPKLSHAANERVRITARKFRMEMSGLLRAFEDFDSRWNTASAVNADPAGFLEQWTVIRAALEARMDAEDCALYHDAEEYFSDVLKRADDD